ncbi:hypothetical protein B4135_2630 [Caldibacillus debilis]|uniref:Uncharacterized protein n=1 Tax=Caldibacillus debilis TaxID=301148 RepID=A0A150LVC4_9BACI|nr:hypothetical protein B4135_2630 [Caldibacillus debilis]
MKDPDILFRSGRTFRSAAGRLHGQGGLAGPKGNGRTRSIIAPVCASMVYYKSL